MRPYLDILYQILSEGDIKPTRTETDTLSVSGVQFKHDMRTGFPLLTTKKMSLKNMAAELWFFINGKSSKKELQEKGCHIWDNWCNPQKVPYGHDELTRARMKSEDDLGRIYGVQWRDWKTYDENTNSLEIYEVDQLKGVVDMLQKNPLDRRMIVSAWNPGELDQMALPPCHYAFQCLSDSKYLDLIWIQRSCDTPIGIPYDIGLYGLLLLLLAKTSGLIPRYLIGQLGDTHIYMNQVEGVREQLTRKPRPLPVVTVPDNMDVFNWDGSFEISRYNPHPAIKFEISI